MVTDGTKGIGGGRAAGGQTTEQGGASACMSARCIDTLVLHSGLRGVVLDIVVKSALLCLCRILVRGAAPQDTSFLSYGSDIHGGWQAVARFSALALAALLLRNLIPERKSRKLLRLLLLWLLQAVAQQASLRVGG